MLRGSKKSRNGTGVRDEQRGTLKCERETRRGKEGEAACVFPVRPDFTLERQSREAEGR